jgi:hypothetical protein
MFTRGIAIALDMLMRRTLVPKLILVLAGFMLVTLCHPPTPMAAAIEVSPGAVSDADQAILKELVKAFDRAEAAVQQADLEGLMAFYAQAYNYHGLKRSDVRRVWEEVFAHYGALSSRHVFTRFKVTRANGVMKAYVTCTGGLYGTEKASGKPITIDSWVNEIHYLIQEEGHWRFHGNAGTHAGSVPAGSAPHHPLF